MKQAITRRKPDRGFSLIFPGSIQSSTIVVVIEKKLDVVEFV